MTFCHNCREYKGIFICTLPVEHCELCHEDEECGTEYCIFCEDNCPGCGGDIP